MSPEKFQFVPSPKVNCTELDVSGDIAGRLVEEPGTQITVPAEVSGHDFDVTCLQKKLDSSCSLCHSFQKQERRDIIQTYYSYTTLVTRRNFNQLFF